MEPQLSCVLLTGSKQVYHFPLACCRVYLATVLEIEKLFLKFCKHLCKAIEELWSFVGSPTGEQSQGVSPQVEAMQLSFEYNV